MPVALLSASRTTVIKFSSSHPRLLGEKLGTAAEHTAYVCSVRSKRDHVLEERLLRVLERSLTLPACIQIPQRPLHFINVPE